MDPSYTGDQFLQACKDGSIEGVRKCIDDHVDLNFQNYEKFTGPMCAAQNGKTDVLRYILNQDVNLDLENELGNTALHYACERLDKENILLLLINGANPDKKNKNNMKPGEGNMEAKTFINNIICEKESFTVLTPQHKQKLIEIFNDIDHDNQKCIDINKAIRFNKFVEGESVSSAAAEKDAKDFIKWTSICNKQTANIDEWNFAFAKLLATEPQNFEKFIEEYNTSVQKKGKMKNWQMDDVL